MSIVSLRSALSVVLGREGSELGAREHRLDWESEDLTDAQCEVQAGVVVAAFECADRLWVHLDQFRESRSAQGTLRPQDRDAVVDGAGFPASNGTHAPKCCENTTIRQVVQRAETVSKRYDVV